MSILFSFEFYKTLVKEFHSIFNFSYCKENENITNIYIHSKNIHFQISILYKRGDFFWIGKDNYNHSSKKFGDKARAINL